MRKLLLIGFFVTLAVTACNIFPYNPNDPEAFAYPWLTRAVLIEKDATGAVLTTVEATVDNGTADQFGGKQGGTLTFDIGSGSSAQSTYTIELHGVYGGRVDTWATPDMHDRVTYEIERVEYDASGFILYTVTPNWTVSSTDAGLSLSTYVRLRSGGPLAKELVYTVVTE